MPERREPLQVRFDEAAGRWVLLATVLGSSLAMLDATVVNVALERIGTDLGADLAALQWTLSSYSLTLASLILLGGSLGDRFGRRRVFIIGTAWFAIASALCGLAPNVATLVAARALQGIGGALLTPGSLAIISASFTREDRPRAIGAWSGFGGIAGAIGPLVGGWLVDVWSWRLVFLVNLPLAAVVIAVALRHVPESRDPEAGRRLDVPGAVLGSLGLAGLTYGSIAAGKAGGNPMVVATGAAGVLALVGFVLVERQRPYPTVVLPAVTLFGVGLAALVAPLTATVLAAAPAARVGVASAVNNAVARTGGLLAVSLLPGLAGLTGHDYRNPDAFAAGYRNAMLVNAGMLGLAGFVAAVGIRNQVPQAAPERGLPPLEQKLTHCYTCPVEGPRLETIQPVREERAVEP